MEGTAGGAGVGASNVGRSQSAGGRGAVLEDAAAAPPPPPLPRGTGAATKEHIHMRLEFISDGQTRGILAAQRLAGALAWALLFWELAAQFYEDSNSLLRTHALEWVNIGVGSACLAALLSVGAWFGWRVGSAAARARHGTAVLPRRTRRLLALTSAELALHTLNLCCYLAMNIYALKVLCGWFDITPGALSLISLTIWNVLFCLSISRPLALLPPGSWARLRTRWAARGALHRWLVAACCSNPRCDSPCSRQGSGPAGTADTADKCGLADPEQALPQQQTSFDRSFSAGPASREDALMARWMHAAVFGLLCVPVEVLIILSGLGSMGYLGGDSTFDVCPDGSTSCTSPIPFKPEETSRAADCQQWGWDCSSAPVYTALSIAVAAFMVAILLTFVGLMLFVLAEYRRLPYTPYRVANVAARLTLRTRILTTLFFILCVALLFYANIHACNANLEISLGIGPMMINMTNLLAAEAFLCAPSAPEQSALRLHSSLQQFAWTEAAVPAVQAQRGLPDEPLFCFETALKACYFALHSYRHFRPDSTVSSIRTAMALYGCTHYEWLREPKKDMNCLLAWGPHALVITFRGTQSLANIRADAQRGASLLGTCPMVHTGFLGSYSGHGLDQQVLQRVQQILGGVPHEGAMPAFDTTVVRCCSREHEERGAELEAAAAAALEAEEAAAAGAADGGAVTGLFEDGEEDQEEEEDGFLSEAAVAELLGCQVSADGAAHGCLAAGSTPGCGPPAAHTGGVSSSSHSPPGCPPQPSHEPFRILLTGHSLGGAEATLCAFDLARELPGWGFAVQGVPPRAGTCSSVDSGCSGGGCCTKASAHPPVNSRAAAGGASNPAGAAPAAAAGEAVAAAGEAVAAAGEAVAATGEAGAPPWTGLPPAPSSIPAGPTAGSPAQPPGPAGAPAPAVWLSVYTFGAPRTGNHAFAREYEESVPDSWAVVNDQDLVAKSGKFLFLFKRAGNVVLVNPVGDLIIRPSFLERNVQRTLAHSVRQHLLVSYNRSFAAILRGQHEGKGLSGGAQAMALLAANPAVRELLTRPLAIRHASLRRYIKGGARASAGTSGAATPGPGIHPQAAAAAGTAPTAGLGARRGHGAALLPALSLEGDLSGDIVQAAALVLDPEEAEAAAEVETEIEQTASALQALATGIRGTLAF